MNITRYFRIRSPWYGRLEVLAGVAVLTHLLVIWALPWLIMAWLSASAPAEGRGPGAVYFPPMTDHTQRRVVMPSPDLLYATCPFDLRQQPMRIQADPHPPGYWSIALYAANSDNFFVLNDRQAAGAPVDLLLVGPKPYAAAPALPPGAKVVTAPGGRGLLLMRVLVSDYAAEREKVEAARRTLRCTPLG
jgi:uncharacterized membrane protein